MPWPIPTAIDSLDAVMFIQTEETPNPDTLKFLPGRVLVEGEAVDCQTAEEARIRAPLAAALFEVDGVPVRHDRARICRRQ